MNGTRVGVHVGKLDDVRPGVEIFDEMDVLILEVDPANGEELQTVESIIRKRFPEVPVVVTASDANLQDVRRLMRVGVVDVIPQPTSRSEIETALEYAARAKSSGEGEERGKTISIIKARGGVGATTIAVHLGHSLAERVKGTTFEVCLLDFDLQHGTAALNLDISDNVGLVDLVETPDRLDGSLLRSAMGRHESGLHILAAPRDLLSLETVKLTFVDNCLRVATEEFRYVLIDLPSAWTDWSRRTLQASDMIILVMQLTVPSVREARRQLEHLTTQGLGEIPIKVLVNRFEKGWGKSVQLKEAEKALGQAADFFVVNDYQTVSEAANQGVPLSRIAKRTKVEKSVQQTVDQLVKELSGGINELSGGKLRSEPRLRIGLGRQ
jgi:pilus assembly protein CpaE